MSARSTRAVSVLAALLLVAGQSGCARPPSRWSLRPTRGYLLISLDTLRADHLSLYGYPRATTPFLETLAPRAVVFELAIAQFPNTLASHMSIFTGLYPAEHRVYPPDGVLAADVETLPEVFARAGFRTGGFTEGGYMRGRPGFRRGFDAWNASGRRGPREMEQTVTRGLEFLRGLGAEERFFLFLHTYAPHAPYAPPEPYRALYWSRAEPAGARPSDRELTELNQRGERLPRDVLEWYVALYDATINYVDDVLADLFAQLETLGLDDDTTIVITSDHGEEFQEHGRLAHTQLYHETLRVPLLLVHPDLASVGGLERGARALRWSGLVESVDLAPTLYALAGISPRTPPSGRDLLEQLSAADDDDRAWAEAGAGTRALYRRDGERVLHLVETDGAGRVELFDVTADPGERRDVAAERPRDARTLRYELHGRRFEARSPPVEQELDREAQEELRALGYL